MAESYVEYEVTGDAGGNFSPYHWCPTTRGDRWSEETILEMARVLAEKRRVASLKVRRRTVLVCEWEEVDYDRT